MFGYIIYDINFVDWTVSHVFDYSSTLFYEYNELSLLRRAINRIICGNKIIFSEIILELSSVEMLLQQPSIDSPS